MVPPKTHPRYRELVTGEFDHAFQVFSGSMCVSRNRREVLKANCNPEAVTVAVNDVYAFFEKFEKILDPDIKAIFG